MRYSRQELYMNIGKQGQCIDQEFKSKTL